MAKRRFSMTEEFLTKTEEFLDFVEVTGERQSHDLHKALTKNVLVTEQIVAVSDIRLPEKQPRRYFSPQAMESLITSIREHGILQPILVRPLEPGNIYQLVAGERRYRAAQVIGLTEIPVIVRNLSDINAVQVALLENLQREDLNPVEETEAILHLLCVNLSFSKEEVISLLNHVAHIKKQNGEITNNVIRDQWKIVERLFEVVGRLTPDSFRSNRLPLLNLPDDIIEALNQGEIEYTKARAVSQLKDEKLRQELLAKTIKENLSIREIRDYIKLVKSPLHEDSLVERVNLAYKNMKQAKLWQDPKKRKTLEKLIGQIEKLIE